MMDLKTASIRLHPSDDVVVVHTDLTPGTMVTDDDGPFEILQQVPRGHKLAIRDASQGSPILKYGQVIGQASRAIMRGEHVHLHNLHFVASTQDLSGKILLPQSSFRPDGHDFLGYTRSNGQVGTRNYVAVIATVNCSASVAKSIVRAVPQSMLDRFPNVDGVIPVTHWSGCGLIAGSEGAATLRRTLNGYAVHPNVGGVLWIALGCEDNQISQLLDEARREMPVDTLIIQASGGTRESIAKGLHQLESLLEVANRCQRQPASASHLTLGLNCGGSDGYSGITANPALGIAADLLVSAGGCVILGETPEIYGAEQLLINRAVSQDVAADLVSKIKWWEEYTRLSGGSMNSNPAPGNKAGGITTILEKSLGAIAKAGSTPLVGVLDYAEPPQRPGLHFMDTPGYDPVSVTGIVAGGANLICFTTGRGSVFGCKPTPSLKLASNSDVYRRMTDDMDINCGTIVDSERTIEDVGRDIFEQLLRTASGATTASERLGMGDEEMIPWVVGAVM